MFLWVLVLITGVVHTHHACVQGVESVGQEDGVYTHLFVALSSKLTQASCEDTVNNLQVTLSATSELLFNMTAGRLKFNETLEVVLPRAYTSCGSLSIDGQTSHSGREFKNAPLRVGPEHPLFGDSIWTQQPRQCGGSGDYIYMTPSTLAVKTGTAAHQLVGEWAKYRWGVMGEIGYQDDPVYPPGYLPQSGINYQPTTCTNSPLTFNPSDCTGAQTCSPVLEATTNALLTSSVLSVPTLPNVVSLCSAKTHVPEAPTKHNLLCSGLSAWEVFMQHSDYQLVAPSNISTSVPSVRYRLVREEPIKSSVVLVVEATYTMDQYLNEGPFLIDALCQTITNYLEDGVNFAIVYFTDTASILGGAESLTILDAKNKQTFCTNLQDEMKFSTGIDRDISLGLNLASGLMPDGGSILLVAAPTIGDADGDVSEAVAAAGDVTVYPLVYLTSQATQETWFESLSYRTGAAGVYVTVPLIQQQNVLVSKVRQDLTALRGLVSYMQPQILEQVDSSSCQTSNSGTPSCTVTLTGNISTSINSTQVHPTYYLISVYASSRPLISLVGSSNCTEVAPGIVKFASSITYLCTDMASEVEVTVRLAGSVSTVYAETVSVFPTNWEQYSGLRLWTSGKLRDLRYTNTTAPAIFAQVYSSGRQVVGADVLAEVSQEGALTAVSFRDDGTGADVTGSDAIYSAYVPGIRLNNNGSGDLEVAVRVAATGPGLYMPVNLTKDLHNKCCGSILVLPANLEATDYFHLTNVIYPRVTAPLASNLPPGRVTDLRSKASGSDLCLIFTAPGADLDHGNVSGYTVGYVKDNDTTSRYTNETAGLVAAGDIQNLYMSAILVGCDLWVTYTVSAFDETKITAGTSNSVRFFIPCVFNKTLTSGAISGIVVSSILLLLIICLILYLICNWKRRNNLLMWKYLTCSCFKKCEKNKPIPRKSSKNQENNAVQRITSIYDLTREPNTTLIINNASENRSINQKSCSINLGYDSNSPNHRVNRPYPSLSHGDHGSFVSYPSSSFEEYNKSCIHRDLKESTLQTSLPINKVGIPVDDDDHMSKAVPYFLDESNQILGINYFIPKATSSQQYTQSSSVEVSRHTPVMYSQNSMTKTRLNTQV